MCVISFVFVMGPVRELVLEKCVVVVAFFGSKDIGADGFDFV
jgi:hypothetical protein